jgi:hypothetical protein
LAPIAALIGEYKKDFNTSRKKKRRPGDAVNLLVGEGFQNFSATIGIEGTFRPPETSLWFFYNPD